MHNNSCCTNSKIHERIKSRGKKTSRDSRCIFFLNNNVSYRRNHQSSLSADHLTLGRRTRTYARSNYIIVSPENHPRSFISAPGAHGEQPRTTCRRSPVPLIDRTQHPLRHCPPRGTREHALARSRCRQPDKEASKRG